MHRMPGLSRRTSMCCCLPGWLLRAGWNVPGNSGWINDKKRKTPHLNSQSVEKKLVLCYEVPWILSILHLERYAVILQLSDGWYVPSYKGEGKCILHLSYFSQVLFPSSNIILFQMKQFLLNICAVIFNPWKKISLLLRVVIRVKQWFHIKVL